MKGKFEELVDGFINTRIGICDSFLTKELAGLLQQNLLNLEKENRMNAAGIGNRGLNSAQQNKRGDKTCWIENKTKDLPERGFLDQIEQFIRYLNDSCYTGINAYEFHYALYEKGSSYKRHVDQFKNNTERRFSLISYLNTDWLNEDGGELMIYHAGKNGKDPAPDTKNSVL